MPTNQEPFKLVSADNQSGSASPVGTRMAPCFVARKRACGANKRQASDY